MVIEGKQSKREVVVGVFGLVIALIATVASPGPDRPVSRNALASANGRMIRHISEMQTALRTIREYNSGLQMQLATTRQLLEDAHSAAQSALAKLTQERDSLGTKVSTTTEKIEELEVQYQAASAEADQLKQLLSLHDAAMERDAAKEKAKQAEERIRELTLELHRSGIWP